MKKVLIVFIRKMTYKYKLTTFPSNVYGSHMDFFFISFVVLP